jgi:hypothetical protein
MKTLRVLIALLLVGAILGLAVSPVAAASWNDPTIRNMTAANWRDLVSNVTGSWNWTNTTRTDILSATKTNLSALTSNGTAIFANGASPPWQNITPVNAQIVGSSGSLNFTAAQNVAYLIEADIFENQSVTGLPTAGTYLTIALCDAGGTTIVTNSERMGTRLNSIPLNVTAVGRHFTWIYRNTSGSSEVGVCAATSAEYEGYWSIESSSIGRSVLNYFRLP